MGTAVIQSQLSYGAAGTVWATDVDGSMVKVATFNLKDLTVPEAYAYAECLIRGVQTYDGDAEQSGGKSGGSESAGS